MRANEFLKEPEIQVKFLNYRVNISGEIRTPGIYYNYEGNLNMLDAIGMANGITEFADLKNVIVKRQNESNFVTHKVDLTNNSIYSSDVFYLQPNDLVYIPPSDLKRRSVNSDTYAKFLGTISTLLVAAALILRF
jgi:polysaccharide export outer membrane protein